MKILHVITGLFGGGAERALYNLLAGGVARNYEVAVVSLLDEGVFGERMRALGVRVLSLNMWRSVPDLRAMQSLRRIVRVYQPDVIQGWMYHGNLAGVMAARLMRKNPAVVWNVRQSLYDVSYEKLMTRQVIRANRFLSSRVDEILYNSDVSREQHEMFGFSALRSQVIPNGFDTENLRPNPALGRLQRRLLGIPPKARVVGHVARFHPMKNHVGFLRTAAEIASLDGDTWFLLLGREVEYDNPRLAGIVPEELKKRFLFLGERDNVSELMQAMDLLCLSSAWGEAFPNVLGEAMACGVPCVATDVGDSAAIVGNTGIIVPPRDDVALKAALERMLAMSSQQRCELALQARSRIKEQYARSTMVRRYCAIWDRWSLNGKTEL